MTPTSLEVERFLGAVRSSSTPPAAAAEVSLAGIPLQLRTSHQELLRMLQDALALVPPGAGNRRRSWTVRVESAGDRRPAMPRALQRAIMTGDRTLVLGRDAVIYDPATQMLSLVETQRRQAVVHLPDPQRVPWFERAAPLRAVIGRILEESGASLIHAAGVASEHGAALLVGPSGAGKSTTALAAAARQDMSTIGDDVCALSGGATPTVNAVYATTKTVAGTRAPRLGGLLHAPRTPEEKAVHRLPPTMLSTDTHPLRAVLLLDRHGTVPGLHPASAAEALRIIGSTTLPFSPATGPDFLTRLAQTLRQVPVRTLTLHRDPTFVAQQVRDSIATLAALAGRPAAPARSPA